MTTQDNDPPDDDVVALAGEYFLGLLDADGLARVATMRRRDGQFDAALTTWEARLMPLAETLAAVTPPARVWAAIDLAVAPTATRRAFGLWQNLRIWRNVGFGAGGLAVACLVVAFLSFYSPSHKPATPFATATLITRDAGIFVAKAQKTPAGIVLVVSPVRAAVPATKSAELWLILPDKKPMPLGLLATDHPISVPLNAAQTSGELDIATLAISLEPLGGSPSGAVTGPVIAASKFSLI
jgi:anti-sigma-K factor RskA